MTETAGRLEYLREKIGDCTRCPLHLKRTKIVFGEGNPDADIMFVGEAPGHHEDVSGRPFIGPAGKLLNEWIAMLGLQRGDVYIANCVKCRPPENRDPYPLEKEACSPFLHTQIHIVHPKVLIGLGRHAANTLTGQKLTMGELRAAELKYANEKTGVTAPIVAVYHPSFVLRKGRGATEQEALTDLRRALTLAGLSATPG